MQHADDAGRPFVARFPQVEPFDELGIGGRADELHRSSVCDIGEQGTESEVHLGVEMLGDRDHVAGKALPLLGSGPSDKMTSPPAPLTCQSVTVGHMIFRSPVSPSRTCGRIVAKSVYGSGLISASGVADQPSIRCRTALDAASAASFQPVNALRNIGFRSVGFDNQCTESGVAIAT